MRLSELVDILGNEVQFPIKPERITSLLIQGTEIQRFVFVGVNLNTTILRGKFARVQLEEIEGEYLPKPYEIPNNKLIVKVYYAVNQPPEWVRLVVIKELLHTIDPDYVRTATPEQAAILAGHLRLPSQMMIAISNGNGFNVQAFIDYMSDFRAVVVMVPNSLRALICEKYREKKIDEDAIAALVGIPAFYVTALLSDGWDRMRGLWLDIP